MQVKTGDQVTILTTGVVTSVVDPMVSFLGPDGTIYSVPIAWINRVLTDGAKVVAIGQVFKDNDWRSADRYLRVVGFAEDGRAICERVYRDHHGGWQPRGTRSSTSTIRLSSFFKTGGRGYSHVDG